MKKLYPLTLKVFSNIFHVWSVTQQTKDYLPQYRESWPDLVAYAHANLASQDGKSQVLPLPYLIAWKGLPHMFYWDTHAINKGLLLPTNGLGSFASNNALNLLFTVDSFGYVGNAVVNNWGMNLSQLLATFKLTPQVEKGVALERGPMLFSLRIEEDWRRDTADKRSDDDYPGALWGHPVADDGFPCMQIKVAGKFYIKK